MPLSHDKNAAGSSVFILSQQPRKEQTTTHRNGKFINILSKIGSGMVTIISVNLHCKSLLQKKKLWEFRKRAKIPQKWKQIKAKCVPLESTW